MKLTIEVTKSFFSQLKPHSIAILIYYSAYYEKHKKLPSMKFVAKEMKVTHLTIRKALFDISLFLLSEAENKAEVHTYLYKRFKFITPLSIRVGSIYSNYQTVKTDDMEIVWERIVSLANHYYKGSVRTYSKYYWRISVQLKRLTEKIGDGNLDKYIDWYFKVKAPVISYFNCTLFCHSNMINEFNVGTNSIRVKMNSDDYDKVYGV